jgi:hypothetical protein
MLSGNIYPSSRQFVTPDTASLQLVAGKSKQE